MPTLEERYFKYDGNLRRHNTEAEKQMKKAAEEEKINREYSHALFGLKEYAKASCRVIGHNLYIVNKNNVIAPICKQDFLDTLSEKEKNKSYSVIRSAMKMRSDSEQRPEPTSNNKRLRKAYEQLKTSYDTPAETAYKLLYELSNGNFKTLGIILNILLEIVNGVSSSSKPTVILAEKELHEKLINFFDMFSDHPISSIDYAELTKIKGLHRLSIEFYLGSRANVVIDGKIPETELSVKKLSKLMSGKKISVKNPSFPGNLHFANKMPFVYITESHMQYRKMKTIYGAAGFEILSKNIDKINYNKAAATYIRCITGSLKQSLDGNKKELSNISRKVTEDDIFKQFTKDCCRIRDDAVCEKAVLYEAYVSYYKKYFGGEPLTKIIFGKKFAMFGGFETVRPHSSRKYYPYCFKGIELDEKKIKSMESEEVSQHDTTYEKFKAELIKLLS